MPKEKLCVSPLSSLAQGHLFHASGERASPAFTQLMAPAPAEKQQGRARAANTVWQVSVGGGLQCSSGDLSLSESGC